MWHHSHQYRNNIQFENIGLQKFVNKLKNEEGYLDFTITIYFGLCQWNIFYEEKIIQTLPWVRNKDADRVSNQGWKRVT